MDGDRWPPERDDMYSIGVDVSAKRGHDVVVIDCAGEFRRSFCVKTAKEVAARICSDYLPACVAVDSPSGPAKAFMKDEAYRCGLKAPPHPKRYRNCRVCEYEVRRRNISLYFTPRRKLRAWVKAGIEVFEALAACRFQSPPHGLGTGRCVVEYYPYASFCCLARTLVGPKNKPEGRAARECLLRQYVRGVRLQKLSVDQIDALVGAVTARAVMERKACCFGDPCEGTIWTPEPLRDKYTKPR